MVMIQAPNHTWPLLLLAGWLLYSPGAGHAQSATTLKQRIKLAYQTCLQNVLAKQYAKALQAAQDGLKAIDQLEQLPQSQRVARRLKSTRYAFLFYTGRIYQLTAQWQRSCMYYKRIIRAAPDAAIAQKAKALIDKMRAQAGVVLTLKSRPKGAALVLRSACLLQPLKGRTPWRRRVLPGRLKLTLRAPKHQTRQTSIPLSRSTTLSFSLPPNVGNPPPAHTQPPSQLFVAGWIAFGVGAALALSGGVVLGLSLDAESQYLTKRGNPSFSNTEIIEIYDTGSAQRVASLTMLVIAGGAFVAAALVLNQVASQGQTRSPKHTQPNTTQTGLTLQSLTPKGPNKRHDLID